MDKITKTLDTNDLEIKSIDEKKRIIWHKITKEVVDRMGDIIRIDGMDMKNFRKKPTVLYGHSYTGIDPIPVIARNIGFKKEGKALYAGTQFLPITEEEPSQKMRDLINDNWMLHKMKLLGWSISIIPKVTEKIEKEDKFLGYDYKESEFLEYSSVIIPANQEAINDALEKGLISKAVSESWPKEEKLPGEIAEDQLTWIDIGKTKEEVEEQEDIQTDIAMKPYENEHACRLENPDKYKRFTRGKRKHEGKEYSIIFGWYEKEGKEVSEEQAYRYKKDVWTASEARSHCKDHKGSFEAAKDEKCEDCDPVIIEEPGRQGLSPDSINELKEAFDRLSKLIEEKTKLKAFLENLKRR